MSVVAENKGFHPFLREDHPYIFIDSCMQAWPDADFANAHRHGVTAYAVTAWRPHATLAQALEEGMFWRLIERLHDNVIVAETAADIRRAKSEGKAAFIMAAQGGDWIENKLHRIEAMQRIGLRMMLPAYNTTNMICDGALDRTKGGLTRFGELVVDECNRVGVLLDCTHIG
jgi:microsomal dipeptidase-like Zn-dependent dipeptidase